MATPHRLSVFRLAAFLAIALVVAGCNSDVGSGELQGVAVKPPKEKPTFTLTNTSGEPYHFAEETEDQLTLLYFGYLNCPDICPVHMAQIAEVLNRMPDVARDTEVVFVSVDPQRDAPEEIRAWLDGFDPHFTGLTGAREELVAAQRAAGVPPATISREGDDYSVDHSGVVIAYAPNGLNYSIYPFGTRQNEWQNDLQILAGRHEGWTG